MGNFAAAHKLNFRYPGQLDRRAVEDISFCLEEKKHLAIVGSNGSGKSSLAQLLAVLEYPESGELHILEQDALLEEVREALRPHLGIVFQNPDNQIVATTVEEDVAFGPENLGIPNPALRERVDQALARVGLLSEAKREPSALSGGQKQKLAIAGVLAMIPRAIILDEATSMLDPHTAYELFGFVKELAEKEGLTLINITHSMEEALDADEVLLLSDGKLVFSGTPAELFLEYPDVEKYGLRLPQHLALQKRLTKAFPRLFPEALLREGDLTRAIIRALENAPLPPRPGEVMRFPKQVLDTPVQIRASRLFYTYQKDSPLSRDALLDVSFDLRKGEILAVLGPSGAGKSTLMLHLNGLLEKQRGELEFFGKEFKNKKKIKQLRRRVGLVFQYPESQLFAETVYEDIAFGPKQMGLDKADIERRVNRAMEQVGLDASFKERSPFELSGGEMRRVAIAGILAMETEVLILDEPSAGLDPQNAKRMINLLKQLRDDGRSLILVTHKMDDAAELCDRALILKDGRALAFDLADRIYYNDRLLARAQLQKTGAQKIMDAVNKHFGFAFTPVRFEEVVLTLESLLHSAGYHKEGSDGR